VIHVVHLLASPFFGGPERQMLGLARHLPAEYRSTFLTFAERGLSQPFLDEVGRAGFAGQALQHNFPHVGQAVREIAAELRRLRADVLCCSGYKPDILGWRAARKADIPVVAVAHGWTAASWKVRCYEAVDRRILRWFDAVVCVSAAQAERVRRARVAEEKIHVIRNAVNAAAPPEAAYRARLQGLFPHPPRLIVGAAGRLSPEKGCGVLIEAAARVLAEQPDVGFVVFGDGPLRAELERQIAQRGLQGRFILAGFHADVQRFLPHLDLGVMSSFTEGLPVILLELFAAGVPVVATAVGGIPEVIEEGSSGALVPAGAPIALAQRLLDLLRDEPARRAMGQRARARAERDFSCAGQSEQYQRLFTRLAGIVQRTGACGP
jgi:glycosyltransferase involved in cell wall biosynthesis